MRHYVDVIRTPGVGRILAATSGSRLAGSAFGVAVLLAVIDIRGSIAEAGMALAAFGAGVAIGAPLWSRLADRTNPRRVIGALIAGHLVCVALLVLVLVLGGGVSLIAVLSAVLLVGVTVPPTTPVARSLWPRLVSAERLPTAYALDSTLNSAMFVIGPALVAALVAFVPPIALVAGAGAVRVLGDLMLATASSLSLVRSKASPSTTDDVRDRASLILLLAAIALDTFAYGSLQIGASIIGGVAFAGVLIALFAAGEVLGGLVFGAVSWPGRRPAQLIAVNTLAIPVLLALAAPVLVPVAAALYLAAGLTGGARDALNQVVLSATPGASTFAWLATVMWAGYSIGTLVAGQLASAGMTAVAGVATGALALATVLLLMRQRKIDWFTGPRRVD